MCKEKLYRRRMKNVGLSKMRDENLKEEKTIDWFRIFVDRHETRPDTRQSSRGRFGSSGAKAAQNSKM